MHPAIWFRPRLWCLVVFCCQVLVIYKYSRSFTHNGAITPDFNTGKRKSQPEKNNN